ncbi:MAG: hypothetical protein ACM3N6_15865 [Betaproteobacteria bacterium]
MFAGHVGAALGIAHAERRVPLGVFVAAALLLDIVLWALVLLGVESVAIPADFVARHQPEFEFPYSHGLLAAVAWSVAAGVGLAAWSLRSVDLGAAALVGAAVFSHWLLDALVHRPELPLAGAGSPRVGLALWDRLPLALAVEALIVAAGLALYLRGAPLPRGRRIALAALCLLLTAFTLAGMTLAPAPPSTQAMAGSSLLTLLVVCALFGWLGKERR